MSDKPKEEKTAPNKKSAKPATGSWDPVSAPPPKPAPGSTNPPASSGSSPIAWLALLLVIALAAAAGWYYQQSEQQSAQQAKILEGRLAKLESVKDVQSENFTALEHQLQTQLQGQLQGSLSELEARTGGQAMQIERLEAALVVQREELDRFGATDRQDWLLAEAEYLLRLANQRLIMAGDVAAASALLRSADTILLEIDDVGLHQTRAAIAADLAALRAVPTIDVEGVYLQLAALIGRVDQLAIFKLPDSIGTAEAAPVEDWQARLQQGYRDALHKLSEYIVIRRRDVPYEALMDPQWEGLVRQNLRMLLEQSQTALLSGNQVLYRESLARAGHWLEQFFTVDAVASKALAVDIAALSEQTIAVELPDISGSLRQLDAAMSSRLQLEGGQ